MIATKKFWSKWKNIYVKFVLKKIREPDFFCKIPVPNENKMFHVFITNNHIIDEEFLNNKSQLIFDNIFII